MLLGILFTLAFVMKVLLLGMFLRFFSWLILHNDGVGNKTFPESQEKVVKLTALVLNLIIRLLLLLVVMSTVLLVILSNVLSVVLGTILCLSNVLGVVGGAILCLSNVLGVVQGTVLGLVDGTVLLEKLSTVNLLMMGHILRKVNRDVLGDILC